MNLFKTINTISIRSIFILINQISHLVSIPILATRLQIDVFGQVAICFILIQFSWILCDWGIQNYTIEKWEKIHNKNKQNKLILNVFFLNLILSFFILLIIFILKKLYLTQLPINYFFYTSLSIVIGGIIPYWFFLVKRNLQDILIVTLTSRFLYLIFIYYFVLNNEQAYLAILAQGISLLLILVYSFYLIFFKYDFTLLKVNFRSILFLFKNSYPFLVNIFTNNQINVLWALGLTFFGSLESIALYNIADQIYRAGISFTKVVSQSIRIHFIKSSFNEIKNTFHFFCFFYFFIGILVIFFTRFLIASFFPEDFEQSITLIRIIIFVWFFHSIVNLVHYPLLADIKGHKWLEKVTKNSLILHLLGIFFWIIFFDDPTSLSVIFLIIVFIQFLFYYFILRENFYKSN